MQVGIENVSTLRDKI